MDVMKTLDIALGMVFVYLVFSLCVTALNEFIAAVLSSRARWLRKGVTALLTPAGSGVSAPRTKVDAVYRSPFLSAMGRGPWKSFQLRFAPSYVPSWTLVQAILDGAAGASGKALGTFTQVQEAVEKLPDQSPIKVALQNLIVQANSDLSKLKASVEEWFKVFEDQLTAWYRQKTQNVLVGLSLLLAVSMNLDTFAMVRMLSVDAKTRGTLAERSVRAAQSDTSSTILDFGPLDAAKESLANGKAKGKSAEELGQLQSKVDTELQTLDKKARLLADDLAATGLPMGWGELNFTRLPLPEKLLKILGWLMTAFALSLGAPFWFDLLQKLSSIRSVGKSLLERQQVVDKAAGS